MNTDSIDFSDPAVQQAAKETQRMLDLQYHEAQFVTQVHVADLVEAVRKAQDFKDYRHIQRRLAEHIKQVEEAIGDAKRRLAHADRRRRRLQQRIHPPTQVELDEVEAERRSAEFERELALRLARQFRCVGDAMAWQLYDFQTLYINALGMNDSPGPIALKEGAIKEEEEVERLWHEEGAFALRHDLTNCLRVWDLSIFHQGRSDLTHIYEVKRGDKARVRRRQRSQGMRAKELVEQHMTTARDGILLVHHGQVAAAQNELLRTNFPLLAQAIRRACEEGIGHAANSYFAVEAIDLLDKRVMYPNADMQGRLLQVRQPPAELMVTPCRDYMVSFSDQRVGKPGYGAPYTIYPMPPKLAAAVVTGFLRLVFHLNPCVLVEAFRKAGFEGHFIPPIKVTGGDGPKDYFLLSRGTNSVKIGANVIEQMLFEGLTADDLVASVSREFRVLEASRHVIVPAIVGEYPRRTRVLTTFAGLEELWRASRQVLSPKKAVLEGSAEDKTGPSKEQVVPSTDADADTNNPENRGG